MLLLLIEHDALTHKYLSCLPLYLAERLQVFLGPVFIVNSTGVATITIKFTHFEGTPEQPKIFYVSFLPDSASERLEFEPILQSGIEDGEASLTFNTTENGSISVEAEFRVGLVPQTHRVASNIVHLICKIDAHAMCTLMHMPLCTSMRIPMCTSMHMSCAH